MGRTWKRNKKWEILINTMYNICVYDIKKAYKYENRMTRKWQLKAVFP